jgi:peptidoglycan hydrolase CwlO-like protein
MSTERELGEHSVAIEHMQQDIDKIINDMEDLRHKVDKMDKTLDEIKGGWKVLIGIAALVGGAISYIVTHWIK